MSEQLPQGVFWCWYYDKKYVCFLDREPHEVELRDKMGARTGKFRWFAASEKSVTAALFLHIFDIAPEPGQALKLDGLQIDTPCNCDCCREQRDGTFLGRHARVLDSKTLEEKK